MHTALVHSAMGTALRQHHNVIMKGCVMCSDMKTIGQ